MVAVHTSLRHFNQPWTALLEASQPPLELRPLVDLHTHGGLHARRPHRVLPYKRRHAGSVSPPLVPRSFSHSRQLIRSLITLGVFLGLTLFTFQSKARPLHSSPAGPCLKSLCTV